MILSEKFMHSSPEFLNRSFNKIGSSTGSSSSLQFSKSTFSPSWRAVSRTHTKSFEDGLIILRGV